MSNQNGQTKAQFSEANAGTMVCYKGTLSMARPPTKIYLAGPLAFSELGEASQTELVRLLTNAGYEAVDPFALAPADEIERINRLASLDSQRALNVRIGQPTPARSMTARR